MIVNLHGLNSTGCNNGFKKLTEYFPNEEIISPTYTVHNFKKGIADIESWCTTSKIGNFLEAENLMFVAISTAALFAEYLADKYGGKLVLINPVTDPKHINFTLGLNTNYCTKEDYMVTCEDIGSFHDIDPDFRADVTRLIAYEEDDPILDHTITRDKYLNDGLILSFSGDNHRFGHWEELLSWIDALYDMEKLKATFQMNLMEKKA